MYTIRLMAFSYVHMHFHMFLGVLFIRVTIGDRGARSLNLRARAFSAFALAGAAAPISAAAQSVVPRFRRRPDCQTGRKVSTTTSSNDFKKLKSHNFKRLKDLKRCAVGFPSNHSLCYSGKQVVIIAFFTQAASDSLLLGSAPCEHWLSVEELFSLFPIVNGFAKSAKEEERVWIGDNCRQRSVNLV